MDDQNKLKAVMMTEFKKQRNAHNLSQEQMSEILDITPRSYIDLEKGKYLCRTRVFINFLLFSDNADEILEKIRKVIDDEKQ